MHVLIVGGGAVGSLLAALLGGAGHAVTLARIEERPAGLVPLTLLRYDGARRDVQVRIVQRASEATTPEVIVLATKLFHLEAALDDCAAWPNAPVLTVQNGIGAEALAAARRPAESLLAASLTAAAALRSPREVAWMSHGGIALATESRRLAPLVEGLAADFERQGLRSAVLPDVTAMKWSKLLANLAANAVPAILDMESADVYADPRLYRLEREQVLEALRVLRALGRRPVRLPGAPVPLLALGFGVPAEVGRPFVSRAVAGGRGGKLPSLRIAVQRGEHPTEVCWMNGGVARAGEAAGAPAPVNARLAELVEEVAADEDRRAFFRGRPDRLLGELPAF